MKHASEGIHPGFETQDRQHEKSKTAVSVVPNKGLMSSNFFLKKSIESVPTGDVSGIVWVTC